MFSEDIMDTSDMNGSQLCGKISKKLKNKKIKECTISYSYIWHVDIS